jgi:ligand-binding sensor domain-containing protein
MKAQPVNIKFRANGIANAKTTAVVEDDTSNIWIATSGDGVSRFNPRNNVWQTYTEADGLANTDIRSMIYTADGSFWFGSSNGASHYSPSTGLWRNYFMENGLPNNSVWSLLEDSDGRVWFGTNGGGLAIFTPKTKQWQTVNTESGLAGTVVTSLLEDTQGNVWAGTKSGLSCYSKSSKSWSNYLEQDGLANNQVNALAQDSDGNIWVGTGDGLSKYEPKQKQWKTYTSNDGLGSNYIQTLSFDSQGGLWAGTQLGVSLYGTEADNWSTLTKQDGLSDNMVYGLFQDKLLNLWVATWGGGVSVYNKLTKLWSVYTTPTEFADTYTLGVINSGQRHMWIGTWGAISHYDTNNGNWLTLSSADDLPNNNVQVLATSRPGEVWIGSSGGLMSYELSSQTWQILTQLDGLINDNVTSLLFVQENSLLVGTAKGLCRYDLETKNWLCYTENEVKESYINALHKDHLGNLWVGTNNGLLVKYTDSTWEEFSVSDGLLSAQVNAVTSDLDGNIWIGTAAGLNQYSLEEKSFRDLSKVSVLLSKEINALQLDEDKLWLACSAGLLSCLDIVKESASSLQSFGAYDLTSLALDDDSNLWVTSQGGGVFWMFRHGNCAGYIQNFTAGAQNFSSQFQVYKSKVALGRSQAAAISTPNSQLLDNHSLSIAHNPTLAKASIANQEYLWAGSDEEGLFLTNIDVETEQTQTSPDELHLPVNGLPSRHVTALGSMNNGDVWVGTNAGAAHICLNTRKAVAQLNYPDIPCGPISAIEANDKNEAYLAFNRLSPTIFSNKQESQTRQATSIWQKTAETLAPIAVAKASEIAFERSEIYSICWSGSSGLWVGTSLGIFNCPHQSAELSLVPGIPSDTQVQQVIASDDGKVFALCVSSSQVYDIYVCDKDLDNTPGKLLIENAPKEISAISTDANNTLWLSAGCNLFKVQ